MALKALFIHHHRWRSSLIVISTLQPLAEKVWAHAVALQLRSAQLQLSALLPTPPLRSSVSSPSSLPVAPRNDLISIQTHFVQLPYMWELAGMGPVDYALPPLCLLDLMPKTDHFKNLGQVIIRAFFSFYFHLLPNLSISTTCYFKHSEATCWKYFT